MNALRHHLRRFTWFALCAIGGLVLAPTLAQALTAPQASNPWAEICSAAGALQAVPGAPALPARHGAGLHAEHCPLCSHPGAAPALPPGESAVWQATAEVDSVVEWGAAPALRPRLVWATVQARAPPPRSS
ncbi:MAG: DUF2946 domain-containing protein [Burkholderiaceae bacterium]